MTEEKKGLTGGLKSGPGDGQTEPKGITDIRALIRVRVVDGIVGAMTITKSTLSNTEAFGQGRNNGYASLPTPRRMSARCGPSATASTSASLPQIRDGGNSIGQIFFNGLDTFTIGEQGAAGGPRRPCPSAPPSAAPPIPAPDSPPPELARTRHARQRHHPPRRHRPRPHRLLRL